MARNLDGLKLGRVWNKGKNFSGMSGKKQSEKFLLKLRERNKLNNPSLRPEVKEKMRAAKLGKFGEMSGNWQGGKVEERRLLMGRDEYKQLRSNVFRRDSYICQSCGQRGGSLELHHIKEWCNYPELRFNLGNCITLCWECHKETDNYLHKARKEVISHIA